MVKWDDMKRVFAIAALLAAPMALSAKVVPASPFCDGMVLQRDRQVPVWGKASPGEKVSVEFDGQALVTAADEKGRWRVDLAPLSASSEPRDFVLNAQSGKTVIHDVLVGEVWLASGQSNMALLIWNGGDPRVRDRNGAAVMQIVRHSDVRYANLLDWQTSATPQERIDTFVWRQHRPENVGRGWNGGQSAVAFYFAEQLRQALGVPIGMIVAAAGGTPIVPFFVGNPVWNHYFAPTAPYACRGLIWYQGESDGARSEEEYVGKLTAFLDGWGSAFENPKLPMYIAQICSGGAVARAQMRFAQQDPRAHTAVTYDVGNPWDIHPSEKYTVGLRLAMLALKHEYGWTDVRAESPVPKAARVEAGGRVRLSFENANSFYSYAMDYTAQTPFELAGKDGRWHPATLENQLGRKAGKDGRETCHGHIRGTQLILSSPDVPVPRKVRHTANAKLAAVYNEVALPVGPFEMALPEPVAAAADDAHAQTDAFSSHLRVIGAPAVVKRLNGLAGVKAPIGAPSADELKDAKVLRMPMTDAATGKGLDIDRTAVQLGDAFARIPAQGLKAIVLDFTGVEWDEEPVVYFAADWVKLHENDIWGF